MDMSAYLPVLVAAIASFVLGFLWHGPVFGKQWMKLSGITQKDVERAQAKGGMWKSMLAALVQQIVTAWVLAMLIVALNVVDAAGALQLSFWLWLGLIVTTLLNGVLWERRTISLYLFNIVYHLCALVVISLILALWK